MDRMQIQLLLSWCDCALERLGDAREEIDALNVYPVPDGDTGTNLYLTFEAARQAILDAQPTSLVTALKKFARGALLGARGNSGVILSQLMRAGADQLLRGDPWKPGQLLADTLTLAADAAYAAVAEPVEGTMLSVARAAEQAAQKAARSAPEDLTEQMGFVICAAAEAAHDALERTPEQLETLRLSGVVDAGGRGLCVIFDAAEEVLTGVRPQRASYPPPARPLPTEPGADLSPGGPSYEVMYLLEASDDAVAGLRRRLAALGDSLVVVGGESLWNVHVHVDDVGAAIEAGITAGRPYRVRVTHFADQLQRARAARRALSSGRKVVAFAMGPGLHRLFAEAGAVPVSTATAARCSTGDLLQAIRSAGTPEVIVLPNDFATIRVAEAAAAAARDEGVRTTVIPTRNQVQGLAAVAVHDSDRSFDDDVVAMTSAAGHTRHGAVTVAARDAMTMAGPCRAGDSLGMVEGDFAVVADTLDAAAVEVVRRLLGGGGEMLTLVTGDGSDEQLVRQVSDAVAVDRPDVDVVVYHGAQADYPLLIGVE
jgi:fatty acid kinase